MSNTGSITLPKASGRGLLVDPTAPGYGWRDIIGRLGIRGVGASDPTFAVYQGAIRQYQYAANNEAYLEFHIPHDYAPGTNLYIHTHWSHNLTTVTDGFVRWDYDVSYARGYDQAPFSAPIIVTATQYASLTQYRHMIAETQLSESAGSGGLLITENIEVDGIILVRMKQGGNTMVVSGGPAPLPFGHTCDIHYQSTSVATKQRNGPAFYT